MSHEFRRSTSRRLICLGAFASLTVAVVMGCDSSPEKTTVVKDNDTHAKAVTKNMADFMKGDPYKKSANKENVQVK